MTAATTSEGVVQSERETDGSSDDQHLQNKGENSTGKINS